MMLNQSEKRALFLVLTLLLSVNLAALGLAFIFSRVDILVGVLVIDFVMGGLASLLWLAHQIFPDDGEGDDPNKTQEIRAFRIRNVAN